MLIIGKQMRFAKILCAVALCPSVLLAETVRPNYVGCSSEQALDEFIGAAVANDARQMNALLKNNFCFNIGGLEFSMVDAGFVTSEIRVYAGSTSALLYVPTEATRQR
jgi:hypothetical protein